MESASAMPSELKAHWRDLGLWQESSLGEALAEVAAAHGDVPLLFHGSNGSSEQATLAEVHQRGRALAGSLHALGLRSGDTLAMQLPSGIPNAVVCQAAAALGCVLLPIIHIYGPHELAYILADSGAAALIVPDRWRNIDYLDRLERLPELPRLRHRIVLGEAPAGMLAMNDLPQGELLDITVDPAALALLLYTSGTTAAPKGVRHSSRTLGAELRAQVLGRSPDEWSLSPWPSGHIAGTLAVMRHAMLGRPTILMESWDATAAALLVERHGVCQMSGTPFHLTGLLDAAERDHRDLSTFREFLVGAATVPPALVGRTEDAGIRCVRCYGSTEMPTVSQCVPDDPLDKRLNTDGRPNTGVEVRIVDDAGIDVAIGLEGEVAVRGAERFVGYTDPALDAASFLPGGWFLTGDIGRLDGEGFLAITDRKKDIIIRGGENISSREVEELLLALPGVVEAAAIGIPDAVLGERVGAVLRMGDGPAPDVAAIDAYFRALGVARQKTPEVVHLLEDFPRTPSGKIQKAELRRQIASLQ